MKTVEVCQLPECDYCGADAEFDAKTIFGYWANLCGLCRMQFVRADTGFITKFVKVPNGLRK